MLAKFFITISHCPWRDFISLSNGDKETKQRKRLSTICIKCPQRADHCFWFPRSTVLAKPRTLETLLLANSYIPTLRHQCSRARSMRPRTCTALPPFEVDCSYSYAVISGAGVRLARGVSLFFYLLVPERIARHARSSPNWSRGPRRPPTRQTREAEFVRWPSRLPESTGGEAWGCRNSREGGFQVSVVLRAPCYVGTKSSGLHAGDT